MCLIGSQSPGGFRAYCYTLLQEVQIDFQLAWRSDSVVHSKLQHSSLFGRILNLGSLLLFPESIHSLNLFIVFIFNKKKNHKVYQGKRVTLGWVYCLVKVLQPGPILITHCAFFYKFFENLYFWHFSTLISFSWYLVNCKVFYGIYVKGPLINIMYLCF